MDTNFSQPQQAQTGLSVIPFEYEGKPVRVVQKDGDVWFVAADICAVLDIQNPTQAVQQLDRDERAMSDIGRQGFANIVSEPGMYRLVMRSDKPQARPFQRFVTHDVLPAIRKTGQYVAPNAKPELTHNQLYEIRLKNERLLAISKASTNIPGIQQLVADGHITQEQADISITLLTKPKVRAGGAAGEDAAGNQRPARDNPSDVLKVIRKERRWITKSDLTRKTQWLKVDERDLILENLETDQSIETRREGSRMEYRALTIHRS